MKRKVTALLFLLLSHGACSKNDSPAAAPNPPVGPTATVQAIGGCAPGTIPFRGANAFGYTDDVMCMRREIVYRYSDEEHLMREIKGRHRHEAGRLCNPALPRPCSRFGVCQPVEGVTYGFCRS